MTPDIVQRIQTEMQRLFCCNPTITRIEEYSPESLYTGIYEQVGHTDDWSWIDRVFQVFFILHEYPEPGLTVASQAIIALPKQELQEINTFIEGNPAPLHVYDIADSTTVKSLPQ